MALQSLADASHTGDAEHMCDEAFRQWVNPKWRVLDVENAVMREKSSRSREFDRITQLCALMGNESE